MKPIVQVSLDLIDIKEAMEMAWSRCIKVQIS